MSGVFRKIDHLPSHCPASVYPPPLEDTLAEWRGGGGSITWKTPDTALYSIYVSTLWLVHKAVTEVNRPMYDPSQKSPEPVVMKQFLPKEGDVRRG